MIFKKYGKALLLLILISAFLLSGCRAANSADDSGFDFGSVVTASSVDYAADENWAYYGTGDKDVHLFLICPTVFIGDRQTLNMPIDDAKIMESFVGALNMERGIYEDVCKMYAPFYRQAALAAYEEQGYESLDCFNTAYEDIRAAFVYYMENLNGGRPFVLAGFSQGSDMALRLMREFWEHEEISSLNIAAYLIGWRVTQDDIASYPFLKMAQGEADTGVIVSFNTEAADVESSIIVPDKTLGINPLNWRTDDTLALAQLNKGACFTNYAGEIVTEIPGFTGAYLDADRGTLKVTDVDPALYPPILDIFDRGIYHIYDYQFFYRNLQENVAKRVNAFTG